MRWLTQGEAIKRNLTAEKRPRFQHKYFMTDFLRSTLPLDPVKSILLYGPSGTGKTHFACAHFTNPLVCSHVDDLKYLDLEHDGIVFDDMSFHQRPIEGVIHLVDREMERSIHCRNTNAKIPAKMPKIFTHNTPNPFWDENKFPQPNEEQKNAVNRRVDVWRVPGKLFRHPLSGEMHILQREKLVPDGLPVKPALRREQERIYHCTA